MSGRTVPNQCPYCGDDNLWPHEVETADGSTSAPHGAWECRSCLRAFQLRLLGQLRRPAEVDRGVAR
jgi:transposase-like protein